MTSGRDRTPTDQRASGHNDQEASAYRVVLRTPFFRASVIALLLSGVGVSAASPQLTLFMVTELGASLPVAGLFYLTNLAAPLVGFLVGRWSDRGENRLVAFRICALIGAIGWGLMAVSDHVWMPFAISAFALSAAGAAMGQLFAACRDELSRHPTLVDNQVISMVRMAFTAGYVLGPVLGSWYASAFGYRPMLAATAVCVLAQLVPLGRQRVLRYRRSTTGPATGPAVEPSIAPLLIFLG